MIRKKFLKSLGLLFAGIPLVKLRAEPLRRADSPNLRPQPSQWKNDEINIAWIGHSTVLINLFGTVILTDPVLYQQIGAYIFGFVIGPARYTDPALEIDEIPQPDIVLLSHIHFDHADYRTLGNLTVKFPGKIDCITAANTYDFLEELEWRSLKELDWSQKIDLNGVRITAIEVNHFGWRYPWEDDRSKGIVDGRSFNAYHIEKNNVKIVFGGDTAFTNAFKESGESADIAVFPIGAYNPWRRVHCTPEEAVQMADDMNAKVFIPIHCKTFHQGSEPDDEPLQRLKNAATATGLQLGISEIGATYTQK
jgi:L-ascorbate metabolism protein UlaG (beta-lactamase superfamily)